MRMISKRQVLTEYPSYGTLRHSAGAEKRTAKEV